MPKRKSRAVDCGPAGSSSNGVYPISHFDVAMDLLVSETFQRVFTLAKMYETAGGLALDQTQSLARWNEAVRRWECVQSLSGLNWGSEGKGKGKEVEPEKALGVELEWGSSSKRDGKGRDWEWNSVVLPHPGVVSTKALNPEEEKEWRRWSPQVGDTVLVDLADGSTWPGKIIDRKNFFKARTVPRGYHFFPVRIYSQNQPPICTIKSRLVPLRLRPQPPPDAAPQLLEAYRTAIVPAKAADFDAEAEKAEAESAAKRIYCSREEKDEWNKQVNWVMNERRYEKLRVVREERERRIKEDEAVQKKLDQSQSESDQLFGKRDDDEMDDDDAEGGGKRQRSYLQKEVLGNKPERGGLFRLTPLPGPDQPMLLSRNDPSLRKQTTAASSTSMASFIRPALSDPKNSVSKSRSPRRPPAVRRSTLLPVTVSKSPTNAPGAPSLPQFEFVSPLGPKSLSRLAYGRSTPPPLASVVEAAEEDVDGWTKVESRTKVKEKTRGASAPCVSSTEMDATTPNGGDVGMDQDEEL